LAGTERLDNALREMMWRSDNMRTRAVMELLGAANLNSLAQNIGMTDTVINQTLMGCGPPPFNELTLADAGRLYEGVADQSLLSGNSRQVFYDLMAGRGFDFTGIWSDTQQIIDEEAPPGLTQNQKDLFEDEIRMSYKAGGYTICQVGDCSEVLQYISVAGWFEIPFCHSTSGPGSTPGVIQTRSYVFGIFIDSAPDLAWFDGKNTAAEVTFSQTRAELLREQVGEALENWDLCSQPTPTFTPSVTRTATASPQMTATATSTGTFVPTQAPTHTLTPTVQPSPTPTVYQTTVPTLSLCVGDCDGNDVVTVDELVRGVNIALGFAEVEECPAFDENEDGSVTVDELVEAVNAALTGC
jgi:hypothetical protein